jgi:hypothetical protein
MSPPKVRGDQIVRALAATCIHPDRSRQKQVAIEIEGLEHADLVERQVRWTSATGCSAFNRLLQHYRHVADLLHVRDEVWFHGLSGRTTDMAHRLSDMPAKPHFEEPIT